MNEGSVKHQKMHGKHKIDEVVHHDVGANDENGNDRTRFNEVFFKRYDKKVTHRRLDRVIEKAREIGGIKKDAAWRKFCDHCRTAVAKLTDHD